MLFLSNDNFVELKTWSWKSTESNPVRNVQHSLRSGIWRDSCDEMKKANQANCSYPPRPHSVCSTFRVWRVCRSRSAWLAISDCHPFVFVSHDSLIVLTDVLQSLSAAQLRCSPRARQHLAKLRHLLTPRRTTNTRTGTGRLTNQPRPHNPSTPTTSRVA